ncbi:helix-turn-helix transcriptional regulator [Corynebacterium uterequi]|uniref:helix-turn-helix transcriptional regulator n=1 Tax=Corynebacterium uterequi TaxID=1072256 RepID=UPI00069C67DB|nr:response regulator transcription factor [Corynebacterium uterequi]
MSVVVAAATEKARNLIVDALGHSKTSVVISQASSPTQAMAACQREVQPILVTDAEFIFAALEAFPDKPSELALCVVVVREQVNDCHTAALGVRAGIDGVVSWEDLDHLPHALRCAHNGGMYISPDVARRITGELLRLPAAPVRLDTTGLSPSVQRVLRLVLKGLSNREIANELSLSEASARKYTSHVLHHYDCSSRGELIARWFSS